MAENSFRSDNCNTLVSATTFPRGCTFVKFTGDNLLDPQRDDTRTRIHDHVSPVARPKANETYIEQTAPDACYDDNDDRGNILNGLALARLQHRAKKSTANGSSTPSVRLQERRGSNPDRTTRLTCDDLTSHMTSEIKSNREEPVRVIERPTSSWASKSGRRPKYTESGWQVEDEDFIDSHLKNMEINESNSYAVRRASVNDPLSNSQRKHLLSLPIGTREKLMRRASDSSRSRSYKEVAKELRKDSLFAGSHKKDENNLNCGSSNSSISLTDGELARMRAVSRLSHAAPQLAIESPSSMGSGGRHLPRKLDPLPISQVIGTDMALEEEEEEAPQIARQPRCKCSSWGHSQSVDNPAPRRRGSRELDASVMLFSDPSKTEKNIIPKPKLKPIARK